MTDEVGRMDGMGEGSGKWSITRPQPDQVLIEFRDPSGLTVVARALFDAPAIREFADALNEITEIAADEREKALAPVLALADELEDEAEEALSRHTPQQLLFAAPILQVQRGAAQAAQGVADRIRLAAGWRP